MKTDRWTDDKITQAFDCRHNAIDIANVCETKVKVFLLNSNE